jgi:long-subunit acyl-CoA synthetase (AMP-forming)
MDRPGAAVPGRVGAAIDGVTMRLEERGEILVRGPNLSPGYRGHPPREGEWFATGDLGEVDERGYWRILGRAKFLIVLASGHNVPPEEIEDRLRLAIPGATQVMLVGHGRKSLVALVAGSGIDPAAADAARERINEDAPHYKRVRALFVCDAPWTPESGLLTANGKLKRAAIEERYAAEIARMYA